VFLAQRNYLAVLDTDDGVYLQQRSQKSLRLADAPAAFQVFKGIESSA
jgi:hypothetical protein